MVFKSIAKRANRWMLSPSLCELCSCPTTQKDLGTVIASRISSPGDFHLTRLVLDSTGRS